MGARASCIVAVLFASMLNGCAPTSRADFRAVETWSLSGVVRSSDGLPAPGATVRAENARCFPRLDTDGRLGGGCDSVSTDANGHYTLRIPRYIDEATITAGGRRGRARSHQWVPRQGGLDFTLAPDAEVRGIVTDVRGAPIAGATVRASRSLEVTSDLEGRFILRGVAAGEAELIADHPDHPPLTIEIVAPDPEIRLSLADGAPLQVTVPGGSDCWPRLKELPGSAKELDAGVFEFRALRPDLPVELQLDCFGHKNEMTFAYRVLQPPLPATVTLAPPRLRDLRIEVNRQGGGAIEGLVFHFQTRLKSGQVEVRSLLFGDARGGMSVSIPEGPQRFVLMTIEPRLVAEGWISEEQVLRLTIPPTDAEFVGVARPKPP